MSTFCLRLPLLRAMSLLIPATLALSTSGCRKEHQWPQPAFAEKDRDPLGYDAAQRRKLMRQVVDHDEVLAECAVIEGQTCRYLLSLCAAMPVKDIRKKRDLAACYDRLKNQPDVFRGHAFVVDSCVIIEVTPPVPAPRDLAGSTGYQIVEALAVNRSREIFALRMLVPSESEVYPKLQQGIDQHKNPILRVSGFFMKAYAKQDSKGDLWREPLLITPAPEFSKNVVKDTYDAMADLEEAKMAHLLPSTKVAVPGAEERLVVEVLSGEKGLNGTFGPPRLRIDGEVAASGDIEFMRRHIHRLQKRLPNSEAPYASAVLVLTEGAPKDSVSSLLQDIRSAGLNRIYIKDEHVKFLPGMP